MLEQPAENVISLEEFYSADTHQGSLVQSRMSIDYELRIWPIILS
jgi:hypothetical protein